MGLSMNSRPRVPAESSSHEGVLASAHVAYSCGVNSKSHNPSGRGFIHPPNLGAHGPQPGMATLRVQHHRQVERE
jgi:hypothetical protein